MFTFYDFEVFKYDWLVVFETNDEVLCIHNDRDLLEEVIKGFKILVGFNNYHYDDIILATILSGKNAYMTSKDIIEGLRTTCRLTLPSIDVMQELQQGVSLKEIEANLGESIIETGVDFNIDRPLTDEELEKTFYYCLNDVKKAKEVFEKRKSYFESKFELINTFNLPLNCIKKTRAAISAEVLQCMPFNYQGDCLLLTFDDRLTHVPVEIINFYKEIRKSFEEGTDYAELEKQKLSYNVLGVTHTYGFGGLHGARPKYISEGNLLHIDVKSYYPSLMINYNFMSRTSQAPELFKEMYHTRLDLKAKKDPKAEAYKIVLNSTFGAMKDKFNKLFDPLQANNICITGQLLLTELIYRLEGHIELVQSNTDGLIVKYEDLEGVQKICREWEKEFGLELEYHHIKKIAQRDVNNYCFMFEDGEIEAIGRYKAFKSGTYEKNNLSIIDRALVNYYMHDTPVNDTVLESYKNDDLLPFQIIAKHGATFDGMYIEMDGDMHEVQRVNRTFATWDKSYGGIYKAKGERLNKIPNTSEHTIIHNGPIETFDKTKLDLNYYIELVKDNLF